MPKYKLRYFNKRARGELIRTIFAVAGQEFEDEQFTFDQWPQIKPTMPDGKAPVLMIDGKPMIESLVIARHLGRVFGLCGKTEMDKCNVDLTLTQVTELLDSLIEEYLESDQTKKKQLMEDLKKKVPSCLNKLENRMKETPTKFFVGKEITIADLAVHNVLTTLIQRDAELLKGYPLLDGNRRAVEENSRFKKYLSKRPIIDM